MSMNAFPNAGQLWRNMLIKAYPVARSATMSQSRLGKTAEFIGYSGVLSDPTACWAGDSRPKKASLAYGFAELLWYLSEQKSVKMLLPYAPSYVNFADDKQETDAAYGWRMSGEFYKKGNALLTVAAMLKNNPDDRRAIIALWQPRDLCSAVDGIAKDLPCTLSLQFLLRNNKLNLIVTMRSNDVWLGGIYDVFVFCHLQLLVAAYLKVGLGKYVHNVGSLHVYERNFEQADLAHASPFPAMGVVGNKFEPSHADAVYLLDSKPATYGMKTAGEIARDMPSSPWTDGIRNALRTPEAGK